MSMGNKMLVFVIPLTCVYVYHSQMEPGNQPLESIELMNNPPPSPLMSMMEKYDESDFEDEEFDNV